MSLHLDYAAEFAAFTLLGVALDQTYMRVRSWLATRRGGKLAPVPATSYFASMFLILVLISVLFSAAQRIREQRQGDCFAGVIQYNFGLINDRSKLQKNVSDAQQAFYLDLYNALVHPVDPHDKKARDQQRKDFTDDTTAVLNAQSAIDKARDTRPYRTGKNCVE